MTEDSERFESASEALERAKQLPRDEAYALLRQEAMTMDPDSEIWHWFAAEIRVILELEEIA